MFTPDLPKPQIFGNYLLKGFNDIMLPQAVSFKPQTFGAWAALIVILASVALVVWWQVHRWNINAYRRAAVKNLSASSADDAIALVPSQLRQVANQAYPDLAIGGLTGEEWFDFLNLSAESVLFTADIQQHLEAVTYQSPDVWENNNKLNLSSVEAAVQWIEKHMPQKRVSL
ncbi:DUF4381 domain-containing protein [Vibrio superstes]|uniref:DUF4381 domain-containing protein n=1 Tax=Vibrio superstes NBRC 103154 TaxID=1219062 RepID=A0A511QV03_9VIBR|nr:DUF4381 domain-containing protein [Vibrio superstes]GEM81201.1 hypothetical protein VSU01S_34460 [Vibrio superstes NBRC 103154]